MEDRYDLVIIGAGIHGLILAKTYLEASPSSTLLILDSASSIGGVWAHERLYPGLKTNNLVGSYEFSDYPLDAARYGLKPGQHIPGPVVHEYLKDFASHFDLTRHIRLNTILDTAERLPNGTWRLTATTHTDSASTSSSPTSQNTTIHTSRLTLATGLTSLPSIPTFPAQDTFARPILHSLHLRRSAALLSTATRIVVLGGNKSAFDAAYSAATSASGTEVHMVLRPSGGGPSWVWPVAITPLALSVQRMATTRLFALADPTPWVLRGQGGGGRRVWLWLFLRWLLHRTWMGRLFVSWFWAAVGWFIVRANGYAGGHAEVAKLRPWASVAWMGNSLSIHNYPTDFFALVRQGRIRVHIADVARLSAGGAVHLSDGAVVADVDALVCCTGWQVRPSVRFLPAGIEHSLGVPGAESPDIVDADVQAARAQIRRDTPMLRRSPRRTLPVPVPPPVPPPPGAAHKQHDDRSAPKSTATTTASGSSSSTATPWRLYRFLVPVPSAANPQRNLAFMGTHLSVAATLVAQAQALWLTAYFLHDCDDADDADSNSSMSSTLLPLPLPGWPEMKRQMLLDTEYQRLRHPAGAGGSGERCPDLVFDSLGYVDGLLGDVGVEARRKRRRQRLGWWAELVGRYWPKDYEGIVAEWRGLVEERRKTIGKGSEKGIQTACSNGVAG